jgi:hypothetical protein
MRDSKTKTKTKSKSKSKSKSPPPPAAAPFTPVAAAFSRAPNVTAGKMMASFGLRVNGKIFAMHVRGDLVVKLPAARVDELVRSRAGAYFDPRRDGRLMKEWLTVPPGRADWVALAREAYAFVKTR